MAACGPVTGTLAPDRSGQGGKHQQQGQHRHVLVQRAVAAGIGEADTLVGGVALVAIRLAAYVTASVAAGVVGRENPRISAGRVSRMMTVHLSTGVAADLPDQRSQHHQAHRHQSPPEGMARTKGVGR